jgi:nicotinate-nucleotide adenylyltransferase
VEFIRRASGRPHRIGVLPGAFNPVTTAHLALARSALGELDEVVFVLPRAFPHKDYWGASFPDRLALLEAAVEAEPKLSIAVSEGGLFRDIARECREAYGGDASLSFVCGRDAAERIVNWDYGQAGAIGEMLREFELLVAERAGRYVPPDELRDAIRLLRVEQGLDEVSSTEVRERIASGEEWEHLVPPTIREQVRRIYQR